MTTIKHKENKMITYNNKYELDRCNFAMDVIIKGQDELGLDYIDIADYMQGREFPKETINQAFRVWAGDDINVC